MRIEHRREFYIPKEATPFDCGNTDAAIYTYERTAPAGQTRYFVIGFHGRAQKPGFHFYYPSAEARAKKIASFLEGRKLTADTKAQRRAERKAWKPDYKVGDLFRTCWGYDQTNIEYFE